MKKAAKKMNSNDTSGLESFLAAFSQLPQKVVDSMLAQSGDEDQKTVITAYGDVLIEQVAQLCNYVRAATPKLSAQGQVEVDTFLRLSAANTLLRSANSVASNLASPSSRIGISSIFHEIKKIVRKLLEIFGITLPKWLDGLLNLIDEILDWLVSVGILHLASTLSRSHQNYLAELALLSRLERESAWRYDQAGDEETS
jgi:hypothetical protein